MKRSAFAAIFCSAIAVQACLLGDVEIPIEPAVPNNLLVERLPLKIGVYFEPQLRTYEHSTKDLEFEGVPATYTLKFAVGPKSILLFKSVLGAMFVKVVEFTALPPAPRGGSAVDAVVAIGIDDFRLEIFGVTNPPQSPPTGGMGGPHRASVTYEITLFSPNMKNFSSYTVTGSGESPIVELGRMDTGIGLATGRAMRAAGANFIVAFYEDPAVLSWLAGRGIAMPNGGGDNR